MNDNSQDIMVELHKKHYISLVNICNSRGLNRADSEDVVSEAYCRFWYNIDKELTDYTGKRYYHKREGKKDEKCKKIFGNAFGTVAHFSVLFCV